ncbi:hypothetical protein EF888_10305 [Silicimonas algicola]|nr:hypothetical protein EF888_10305 [Silicimonas algicola]
MVLFAHHSALKDPPFIHLDLVACRNLLIYLEREVQHQLLALFHYSLEPGGYLFLGSAESADTDPKLFAPCDREARVYSAKSKSRRSLDLLMQLPPEHRSPFSPARDLEAGVHAKPSPVVHAAALEQFAPPSILVDDEHRILNLSKSAGQFIRPPEGPFTSDLPSVLRAELRSEIVPALNRAFEAGEPR